MAAVAVGLWEIKLVLDMAHFPMFCTIGSKFKVRLTRSRTERQVSLCLNDGGHPCLTAAAAIKNTVVVVSRDTFCTWNLDNDARSHFGAGKIAVLSRFV